MLKPEISDFLGKSHGKSTISSVAVLFLDSGQNRENTEVVQVSKVSDASKVDSCSGTGLNISIR